MKSHVVVDYMKMVYKMPHLNKCVNYVVEVVVEVVVHGLQVGMVPHNHVHALIHVHQEDIYQGIHVLQIVVMEPRKHVLVHTHVHQEDLYQEQRVIHNLVMEPPLHVRILAPLVAPYLDPHVRSHRAHHPIIRVRQVGPYQDPHARSPHQERRNMDAPWEEVWWEDNVSFLQDNVCEDSCVASRDKWQSQACPLPP